MASRSGKWAKFLARFLFVTLILSMVYTLARLRDPRYAQDQSHYTLMFVQCALGLVVMLLPGWISKKWSIQIPSLMMIFYLVFLYAAIFLGEVRDYYYRVPHWDVILHAFSGFMLGCLAFSFITLLNRAERVPLSLSPVFVAVFALCFSIALGVAWEVYEYTFDGLLGLNMQKFILADGTVLSGHAALTDTMKDLMVDALGALVASAVGYVSLKYKKGWIEKFQIRKK
ncbi:MAG: hypothetical protein IJ461_06215 [Clostridia bacterium]|nr:hypothetical protein [Clostridia bacterium]